MTFHPKFAENRYCYVCYVLKGKGAELADGSRLSRFTMSKSDPPRIDPASEIFGLCSDENRKEQNYTAETWRRGEERQRPKTNDRRPKTRYVFICFHLWALN